MNGKSIPTMATPVQVRRADIVEYNDVNRSSSKGKELLQIGKLSDPQTFKLPDDWLVEERSRPSKPSHKDRYYYEPRTGRQFRSLLSVQKYLTESTSCTTDFRSRMTEGTISENENKMQVITDTRESTSFIKLPNDWIVKKKPRNSNYAAGVRDRTYIKPDTGRRFRPFSAIGRYLTQENACTATTKSTVKSGTGKQSAHSSLAEEGKITLKASTHSTKSTEFDSPKEINSGKNKSASNHNLSKPPTKVNWVLDGPGAYWKPFLDDSIVPDSEKLKWSEAFILAIHGGATN